MKEQKDKKKGCVFLICYQHLVKADDSMSTMYGAWGPDLAIQSRSSFVSSTWRTPVSPDMDAREVKG